MSNKQSSLAKKLSTEKTHRLITITFDLHWVICSLRKRIIDNDNGCWRFVEEHEEVVTVEVDVLHFHALPVYASHHPTRRSISLVLLLLAGRQDSPPISIYTFNIWCKLFPISCHFGLLEMFLWQLQPLSARTYWCTELFLHGWFHQVILNCHWRQSTYISDLRIALAGGRPQPWITFRNLTRNNRLRLNES